eukprot:gene5500-biopygen5507
MEVKREWFSTDASTGAGMGAVLDKHGFAITWACLRSQPQEDFFPFNPDNPKSKDIGYLELFTLYWALVLWGKHLEGRKSVVVHIDNTCVIGQVERWHHSVWIEARDDWMLPPNLWKLLDVQFGPFTVDLCVSQHGANSFCRVGWTKEDGARFMDFRGHNYWGNLPFSGFLEIIQNFLRCEELDKLFARTAIYQSVCFALNTQASYSTGVRSFVSFYISCRARDFLAMMFPATDDVLAWWIVFMVTDRKVKPSTAKKYTSSVRALHLQLGVGSREGEVDIRVRHSKTIEAGERYHTVRAVEVPDSPICVLMALWRDWQMPNLGPLFCTEDAKGRLKPLTHSVFVAGFRKLTARAGPDPAAYIGNSFRRGGATATCELQVQDALIQAHGDWASECYKLYCDMDSAQQLILPSAKATGVAIAIRAFEMRA